MDVRYKRDLNSNYMILTERGQEEENYEVRMVTENRIGGFLPCVCQKREGCTEYYYEITGKQSMNLMYERRKLNCRQLKSLLKDLEKILEAAGEYLLNPDHFLLKPEYMYLHTRTEKLFLCFDPAYEGDMREAFLDWAEYLLGKLDKSDSDGIAFGYELYQSALEPNFSLMEILRRHTEEKESEPLYMRKEPEEIQEEKIIPLILQPLVENAFEHGIKDVVRGGEIYIGMSFQDGMFLFSVRDNGSGITEEEEKRIKKQMEDGQGRKDVKIHALSNTDMRLKLHYGAHSGITFYNRQEGGFCVTAKINLKEKREHIIC